MYEYLSLCGKGTEAVIPCRYARVTLLLQQRGPSGNRQASNTPGGGVLSLGIGHCFAGDRSATHPHPRPGIAELA